MRKIGFREIVSVERVGLYNNILIARYGFRTALWSRVLFNIIDSFSTSASNYWFIV